MPEKTLIGEVIHYYTKLGVAVIELSGQLKKGDKISTEGATTNIQQAVASMQIENKKVDAAKKGQSIGMKVKDRVREGDKVYKAK